MPSKSGPLKMKFLPGDGGEFSILHGDDGQPVITFKGDEENRRFIARVDDEVRFILVNAAVESTKAKKTADHSGDENDLPPGCSRNWKIEDGTFIVWIRDKEVRLNVLDSPRPSTPTFEPEIFGQEQLLFDICMAIAEKRNTLLVGPTGVGKTSIFRWLAYKLNWNYVIMPITRGTQDPNMIGEYMPVGPGEFDWVDGPVTHATRLSQDDETILVFDEMNRIGNVAEFARIYSLLDDSRLLSLSEKRNGGKSAEVVRADKLFIAGTANPVDSEDGEIGVGDYIGVQELDPALSSRFHYQPPIPYPPATVEAAALASRVEDLGIGYATKMIDVANRIREAAEIRFPISFRDLIAWGEAIPYQGWKRAAEIAIARKAHPVHRQDIMNLILLEGDL